LSFKLSGLQGCPVVHWLPFLSQEKPGAKENKRALSGIPLR
jgi:hypothetical protein